MKKQARQLDIQSNMARKMVGQFGELEEILDMLYLFNLIEKKGAWISISQDLIQELSDKKLEINEKFQGEQRLIDFLEENEKLSDFLYEDFKNLTNAL